MSLKYFENYVNYEFILICLSHI